MGMNKYIARVSITNSKDVTHHATHCNRASIPHPRSMPFHHVMAKLFHEEKSETCREVTADNFKRFAL
jgi:hypothetical protein